MQAVTTPVSSLLPTNLARYLETKATTTAWVVNENAARQVVTGLNPATVDRVHSLQIATPGLLEFTNSIIRQHPDLYRKKIKYGRYQHDLIHKGETYKRIKDKGP